ncbi:MAG: MFS transporter, partial [Anaeromyxobacteraceae bacterium]
MKGSPIAAPVAGAESPEEAARWTRASIGVGVAGFSAFLGVYATQPLLPTLEREFGVGKAAAGLTVSATTIAVALASPFAGYVAGRFGHRRVIVAALFCLAAPMLLAATSGSVGALVAWRFAQGLFVPFTQAVAIGYIAELWPAHRVGRAMSALVSANVIGGFSGRLLSGLAATLAGWRASFVLLGLVTIGTAFAAARALPSRANAGGARTAARSRGPALGLLLASPRLLATFAVGFNVLFTQIAIFTYVTFHLAAPPFELGAGALSWIFVVYLVGAFVTPIAGRWIDRVGSRRAVT